MSATQVSDPRELMQLQLSQMLFTERTLADQVLPQLSQEVQNQQLRQGIEMHREQTQQHAQNLEQVFQILGMQPQTQQDPAMQGLKQSHDQVVQSIGSQELRDVFDAEAAAKTEHLEIAGYRGLISMAQQMGQQEAVQLLQQNCRQEEQALQQLESMTQQLCQQMPSR